MSTRMAVGVEYLGTHFSGWQRQPGRVTVQGTLESALSRIADRPIETVCAGRTDKGVHATAQVVHFDVPLKTAEARPMRAWLQGTHTHLPPSIRITWATPVNSEFSARFTATARRYHYFIHTGSTHSAILSEQVTLQTGELATELMHQGAQHLLGEQDFSAFRAADCQSKTPFRCIEQISVSRQASWVVVDVTANAFLHHMVRNIVGVLLKVGQLKQPPIWVKTVLASRDRRQAAPTAPPTGLYLVGVRYPQPWALANTAYRPVPFCSPL